MTLEIHGQIMALESNYEQVVKSEPADYDDLQSEMCFDLPKMILQNNLEKSVVKIKASDMKTCVVSLHNVEDTYLSECEECIAFYWSKNRKCLDERLSFLECDLELNAQSHWPGLKIKQENDTQGTLDYKVEQSVAIIKMGNSLISSSPLLVPKVEPNLSESESVDFVSQDPVKPPCLIKYAEFKKRKGRPRKYFSNIHSSKLGICKIQVFIGDRANPKGTKRKSGEPVFVSDAFNTLEQKPKKHFRGKITNQKVRNVLRRKDYSAYAKKVLIELISQKKDILEPAKLKKVKRSVKRQAWDFVAEEYNSIIGGDFKTVAELKVMYAVIKNSLKAKLQKLAAGITEKDNISSPLHLSEEEQKVLSLLSNSFGLVKQETNDEGQSEARRDGIKTEGMEYLDYLDYLTQQYCGKEEEKCSKKSPTKTPRKNPPENRKRKIKKEKTEISSSAHEKGGLVKNRKEKSSKSRRNKLLDKLRLVIPANDDEKFFIDEYRNELYSAEKIGENSFGYYDEEYFQANNGDLYAENFGEECSFVKTEESCPTKEENPFFETVFLEPTIKEEEEEKNYVYDPWIERNEKMAKEDPFEAENEFSAENGKEDLYDVPIENQDFYAEENSFNYTEMDENGFPKEKDESCGFIKSEEFLLEGTDEEENGNGAKFFEETLETLITENGENKTENNQDPEDEFKGEKSKHVKDGETFHKNSESRSIESLLAELSDENAMDQKFADIYLVNDSEKFKDNAESSGGNRKNFHPDLEEKHSVRMEKQCVRIKDENLQNVLQGVEKDLEELFSGIVKEEADSDESSTADTEEGFDDYKGSTGVRLNIGSEENLTKVYEQCSEDEELSSPEYEELSDMEISDEDLDDKKIDFKEEDSAEKLIEGILEADKAGFNKLDHEIKDVVVKVENPPFYKEIADHDYHYSFKVNAGNDNQENFLKIEPKKEPIFEWPEKSCEKILSSMYYEEMSEDGEENSPPYEEISDDDVFQNGTGKIKEEVLEEEPIPVKEEWDEMLDLQEYLEKANDEYVTNTLGSLKNSGEENLVEEHLKKHTEDCLEDLVELTAGKMEDDLDKFPFDSAGNDEDEILEKAQLSEQNDLDLNLEIDLNTPFEQDLVISDLVKEKERFLESDESTEPFNDQFAEQSRENFTEQCVEPSTHQLFAQSVGQSTNPFTGPSAEQYAEESSDQATRQTDGQCTDQFNKQSTEESTEQPTEQIEASYHSPEEDFDKEKGNEDAPILANNGESSFDPEEPEGQSNEKASEAEKSSSEKISEEGDENIPEESCGEKAGESPEKEAGDTLNVGLIKELYKIFLKRYGKDVPKKVQEKVSEKVTEKVPNKDGEKFPGNEKSSANIDSDSSTVAEKTSQSRFEENEETDCRRSWRYEKRLYSDSRIVWTGSDSRGSDRVKRHSDSYDSDESYQKRKSYDPISSSKHYRESSYRKGSSDYYNRESSCDYYKRRSSSDYYDRKSSSGYRNDYRKDQKGERYSGGRVKSVIGKRDLRDRLKETNKNYGGYERKRTERTRSEDRERRTERNRSERRYEKRPIEDRVQRHSVPLDKPAEKSTDSQKIYAPKKHIEVIDLEEEIPPVPGKNSEKNPGANTGKPDKEARETQLQRPKIDDRKDTTENYDEYNEELENYYSDISKTNVGKKKRKNLGETPEEFTGNNLKNKKMNLADKLYKTYLQKRRWNKFHKTPWNKGNAGQGKLPASESLVGRSRNFEREMKKDCLNNFAQGAHRRFAQKRRDAFEKSKTSEKVFSRDETEDEEDGAEKPQSNPRNFLSEIRKHCMTNYLENIRRNKSGDERRNEDDEKSMEEISGENYVETLKRKYGVDRLLDFYEIYSKCYAKKNNNASDKATFPEGKEGHEATPDGLKKRKDISDDSGSREKEIYNNRLKRFLAWDSSSERAEHEKKLSGKRLQALDKPTQETADSTKGMESSVLAEPDTTAFDDKEGKLDEVVVITLSDSEETNIKKKSCNDEMESPLSPLNLNAKDNPSTSEMNKNKELFKKIKELVGITQELLKISEAEKNLMVKKAVIEKDMEFMANM